MWEALQALWLLFIASLGFLLEVIFLIAVMCRGLLPLLPAGLWCAWWLWCVNWKKVWPVMNRGGWIAVVLFVFASALAWSVVFPSRLGLGSGFSLPNFWWQLGACAILALVALFCGWVQQTMGWTPAEVSFDPPADHGHGHGHAHH